MRSVLMVVATAVSVSLLACGVAQASITLFEPPLFRLGSVNGQSGVGGYPWKSGPPFPGTINCLNYPLPKDPPPPPFPTHPGEYDQEVVTGTAAPPGEPPGFGSQSLRMSNACASGEFSYQTYSAREPLDAGEEKFNKVFMAQFSFMSKTRGYQPGLFLSVSPDSYEGSRMSYVGLKDTEGGIQVTVSDTPEEDGEFVSTDVALLSHKVPHTIRFWIEANRGPDNDRVQIAVDGVPVDRCFTTWENYYRTAPEQKPPPNINTPAIINSLQFRSSVPGPTGLADNGYLFDNVSMTPSNGPGPPPRRCSGGEEGPPDIDVDKETQTQSALPGDTITYRISVRNRGDAPVRGLRACDRVPRALRFVGASTRLRRAAGRRLCRTIRLLRPGQRKTFRATFQLRTNVTANTITNGATADTPTASPPSPSPPDAGGVLPAQERRRPVARDDTTIRVRRAEACGAAVNPRAHAAC
jgi:uncharacterized repeat protein (TIGR01451 family)